MDTQYEKMLGMINGQSVTGYEMSRLTDQEKQQINNAIEVLFIGETQLNWIAGGTLGDAWTKALDSTREKIFSIQGKNPAVLYARYATFEHRKRWHTNIVMSHEAHNILNCPNDKKKAWTDDAETKILNAIEILQNIIARFESGTPRDATQPVIEKTQQNIKTIGERENVHEREY